MEIRNKCESYETFEINQTRGREAEYKVLIDEISIKEKDADKGNFGCISYGEVPIQLTKQQITQQTGLYGSIIKAEMRRKSDEGEDICKNVAVKTYRTDNKNTTTAKEQFDREVKFFEDDIKEMKMSEEDRSKIVKYYGKTKLDDETECFIMEDLNKQGFINPNSLIKLQKRHKEKVEQIEKLTKEINELKQEIEKQKIEKQIWEIKKKKAHIEEKAKKIMTSLAFKYGPEYSIGTLVHQTIYSLYTKYGIQHNDLHCNNVMINFKTGECKLIDFGSVFVDKEADKNTRTDNTFMQTKDYDNIWNCDTGLCGDFAGAIYEFKQYFKDKTKEQQLIQSK